MNIGDLRKQEKVIELKGEGDKSLRILYSSPTVLEMEEIVGECQKRLLEQIIPEIQKLVPEVIKEIKQLSRDFIIRELVKTDMAIAETCRDLMNVANENSLTDEEKEKIIEKGIQRAIKHRQEVLEQCTIEDIKETFLNAYIHGLASQKHAVNIIPKYLSVMCKHPETKERIFSYDGKDANFIKNMDKP